MSEATIEGKPAASLAESVADKRVTDFDWWQAAAAGNVAETFADTPRWRCFAARISDTATGTAAARVLEDKLAVVARKATDRPGIAGGSVAMEWVAIARCISVESRNRDCCRDCSRLTMRPDKIPHPLSARSE